jgi:hypothetical protein
MFLEICKYLHDLQINKLCKQNYMQLYYRHKANPKNNDGNAYGFYRLKIKQMLIC